MASKLKRFVINIPPMQTLQDVQQAMTQAFTNFQNQLLSQLPVTDMGGERVSNVAFPQDADDVVTLRYLSGAGGFATSTATSSPTVRGGGGALVEVVTSTATYNLPSSGVDVVTLNTGVLVVNLPDLTLFSTSAARPIWLVNATGTNVTLNPQSGQTLEGHATLTLYPNVRLQLMPNA